MYKTLNNHYREKFSCKVYKLSIDGGFSCPNRDGKCGTKGCIFCGESGSGDFAEFGESISEQLEKAKKWVEKKNKNGRYMAYFQSFTNTYAPIEYLEKIFTQAINHPKIVALSIGTRPDCLGDDVLNLLDQLNKIKPVFIELGLQSIHPSTAEYINRGYDISVFDLAVKNLKKININVIVHIILGLPYETEEMMYQTVKYVCNSGIDGIKLQLLHVLKNTKLAEEYEQGKFEVLSLENYTDIICNCIEIIPNDIVIHRITGDGAKKLLIAPQWSGNKKLVLNTINKALSERNIVQGSKCDI